jgi:hypothetical protein
MIDAQIFSYLLYDNYFLFFSLTGLNLGKMIAQPEGKIPTNAAPDNDEPCTTSKTTLSFHHFLVFPPFS